MSLHEHVPRRHRRYALGLRIGLALPPPPRGLHQLVTMAQGESSNSPRAATSSAAAVPGANSGNMSNSQTHIHPAENSKNQPHAPIGNGTAAANDIYHQQLADKSAASSAAVSDASARGQTTKANGSAGTSSQKSAAAAAIPAATSQPSSTSNKQDRTREAERIVEEERQASEKLPNYPGLAERFNLISKMGE